MLFSNMPCTQCTEANVYALYVYDIYKYTHTYIHENIHTYIHAYIHTCMHTCILAYTHAHIHVIVFPQALLHLPLIPTSTLATYTLYYDMLSRGLPKFKLCNEKCNIYWSYLTKYVRSFHHVQHHLHMVYIIRLSIRTSMLTSFYLQTCARSYYLEFWI